MTWDCTTRGLKYLVRQTVPQCLLFLSPHHSSFSRHQSPWSCATTRLTLPIASSFCRMPHLSCRPSLAVPHIPHHLLMFQACPLLPATPPRPPFLLTPLMFYPPPPTPPPTHTPSVPDSRSQIVSSFCSMPLACSSCPPPRLMLPDAPQLLQNVKPCHHSHAVPIIQHSPDRPWPQACLGACSLPPFTPTHVNENIAGLPPPSPRTHVPRWSAASAGCLVPCPLPAPPASAHPW